MQWIGVVLVIAQVSLIFYVVATRLLLPRSRVLRALAEYLQGRHDPARFRPRQQVLPHHLPPGYDKQQFRELFERVEAALNGLREDLLADLAGGQALASLERAIRARRTDSDWRAPAQTELIDIYVCTFEGERATVRFVGRRVSSESATFAEDWMLRRAAAGWVVEERSRCAEQSGRGRSPKQILADLKVVGLMGVWERTEALLTAEEDFLTKIERESRN